MTNIVSKNLNLNLNIMWKVKKNMARKQLKALNLKTYWIGLILDAPTSNRYNKVNTLSVHDLSVFHYLNGLSKNEFCFPDFAIYKRLCFAYDVLTCSIMHLLSLG